MAVYLSPGVYIEEIPGGARPIEGVATSVAAIVGPANRGPVDQAVLIGKLDDYKALYGDIASENDAMGLAVQTFYLNGGKSAYICRLAGATSVAAETTVLGQGAGGAPTAAPVLTIRAKNPGTWGNDVVVRLIKPDPDATSFDLEVGAHDKDGKFVRSESYLGLTMRANEDTYAPTVVNEASNTVDLVLGPAAEPGGAGEQYQEATITGGAIPAGFDFAAAIGGALAQSLTLNINGRGSDRITVNLVAADLANGGALALAVQGAIRAHSPLAIYQGIQVQFLAGPPPRFRVSTPESGSDASLEIGDGPLARVMRLTAADRATLTGLPHPATATRFSANAANLAGTIVLTLDELPPATLTMPAFNPPLAGVNAADGARIATAIQTLVRNAGVASPAFRDFACTYDAARQFVLSSGGTAPRVSGITVANGTVAAFLQIQSSTANVATSPGRQIEQGTARVIPVQRLGIVVNGAGAGERLSGGTLVAPSAADYTDFYGTVLRKRRDVTMLLLPGQAWTENGPTAEISSTIAHAEAMMNRMVLVDPPQGHELADASVVDTMILTTSTYAVMYYPWVSIANPLYNVDTNATAPKTVLAPPSAFAAGLWTRTDNRRGVWKAPAGVETQLISATSLEYQIEDTEQAQLNPLGVNCLRTIPSFGPVIWGARTLSTKANPEWRYVPIRRTAIFIEQSIYNGIQWAVFEPNDHPLWGSLRANIGAFMNGLFRAGAFQGKTSDEAYFVRCNLGDTMTQGDIDRGQVIVIIGFAPLKPAEFVIVRIQQKVGQQ
jgi:phage tail sheath protein FI